MQPLTVQHHFADPKYGVQDRFKLGWATSNGVAPLQLPVK